MSHFKHLPLPCHTIILTVCLSYFPLAGNATSCHASPDSTQTFTLEEVQTHTSRYIKKADRDIYVVTPQNVEKAADVLQLIAQIHGIRYNALDENLEIKNSKAFRFQVNGIEKSKEQISQYAPETIRRIEIIHTPDGRYTSLGIKYIVNLITKEDCRGLDLTVKNLLIASLSWQNGDHPIANEQPKISLQYLSNKWNINAGYGFATIHWNYPVTYEKRLSDGTWLETAPATGKNPTELNGSQGHFARFGLDFTPNPHHTLSLNTVWEYEEKDKNTHFRVTRHQPETGWKDETDEHSGHRAYNNDFRGSLTYHGKLHEKWKLNANLNYNRKWDNSQYNYQWGKQTNHWNHYENKKEYISQAGSAIFNASDKLTVDVGFLNVYNRYTYRNQLSEEASRSGQETVRAQLFGYIQYNPTKNWGLRAGLTGNYLWQDHATRGLLRPELMINYHTKSFFSGQIHYSLYPTYPKQYQLSPETYHIDSLMIQTGNPGLRSLSQTHMLELSATFWDNLTLTGLFIYNPHEVSAYYYPDENGYTVSSFRNNRQQQILLGISYDWELSSNLVWSNSIQVNHYCTKNKIERNRNTSILIDSDLQYYHEKWGLMVELNYMRNQIRYPLLQGYGETGQDLWECSLNKWLCKRRLQLSLVYLPPLELGIRKYQTGLIDTPSYYAKNKLRLSNYNNMLLFRMTWNLHRGKKTKQIIDKTTYDDESPIGRGLM